MAIFVPPTVFSEVEAVFDSPMISDVTKNIQRSYLVRIQAGNEVTLVIKHNSAVTSN